jgi:hypothetical protein
VATPGQPSAVEQIPSARPGGVPSAVR